MGLEFLTRILNVLGIIFLIIGFTSNCNFLYAGTFCVVHSEIILWYCLINMYREPKKMNQKSAM